MTFISLLNIVCTKNVNGPYIYIYMQISLQICKDFDETAYWMQCLSDNSLFQSYIITFLMIPLLHMVLNRAVSDRSDWSVELTGRENVPCLPLQNLWKSHRNHQRDSQATVNLRWCTLKHYRSPPAGGDWNHFSSAILCLSMWVFPFHRT